MIVALEPPNLYLAYFKGVGVSQIPRCRATGHALASLKEPFGSLASFAPEGNVLKSTWVFGLRSASVVAKRTSTGCSATRAQSPSEKELSVPCKLAFGSLRTRE